MTERTPSTEIALPSAQLLCENIIDQIGSDRGNGMRPRFDADWSTEDYDGQAQKIRLIRQGLGSAAVYTLRIADEFGANASLYRYGVASGEVTQRVQLQNSPMSDPYIWEESALHGVLWSGLAK